MARLSRNARVAAVASQDSRKANSWNELYALTRLPVDRVIFVKTTTKFKFRDFHDFFTLEIMSFNSIACIHLFAQHLSI